MRIAQVVGKVTLSRVHPTVAGLPLRMVQPLSLAATAERQAAADADLMAAVDLLGSGYGDLIFLAEGPEAAQPFLPDRKPLDAYNAAILDALEIDPQQLE